MGHLGSALRVSRWDSWQQSPRWLIYAIACELTAILAVISDLVWSPPTRMDFVWLAVLVALGIAQAEMSRRIERMRRWMAAETHINLTSVWCLAGAVLLTPATVSLLTIVLYAHLWLRVWRHVRSRPLHRVVVSTAWALLSSFAAALVLRLVGLGGLDDGSPGWSRAMGIVLTACVVFELINAVLVATGIFLYTAKRSWSELLGTGSDNALEVVTLCLGSLTALVLVSQPLLVVLVLPPLLMLHRSVLVKQLEVAATTDDKTGLLNAVAWHDTAQREFVRSARDKRSFGILMVDLDYFKRVNDTYGHVAGDVVLREVASVLQAEVRDYDAVGRFGGEEFAVLLPGIPEPPALVIAERIRRAVADLAVDVPVDGEPRSINSLSVSIGIAVYPQAGENLERLLLAADTALYRAKHAGRNRVVSVTS